MNKLNDPCVPSCSKNISKGKNGLKKDIGQNSF